MSIEGRVGLYYPEPVTTNPLSYYELDNAFQVFEHLNNKVRQNRRLVFLLDSDFTLRNNVQQAIRGHLGRVPDEVLGRLKEIQKLQPQVHLAVVTDQPIKGHQIARICGRYFDYSPAPFVYQQLQIPVFGSPGWSHIIQMYKNSSRSVQEVGEWIFGLSQQQLIHEVWHVGDSGSDRRFINHLHQHLSPLQTQNSFFAVKKWWW